ncbi:hypothetical protein HB779_10745 [Phyllobacterium sp. 628]|uniref:hypothetical protein n=1 Tax=Phyllobacterium sp. 628 TaxID=2718938 RepID=UPI0016626F4B|nr:hypothetical protein [Phyllobacterium sp. 628]QND52337.1 hypothetical protein HB779_10745 [Phyllobacterium sp. 628]
MHILYRILLPAFCLASIGPAIAGSPPAFAGSSSQTLIHPVQYDNNPCTDGRYNDGRPRSCREILRMLERRDRYRERQERYDPCTDGRISDGRPRSCREIRHWLRERDDEEADDWQPRRRWK